MAVVNAVKHFVADGRGPSDSPTAPAKSPVAGPFKFLEIIFIILAIRGFLGALVVAVANLVQLVSGGHKPPPNMDPSKSTVYYIGFNGAIFSCTSSIFFQPLILWAGINMLRLKGRRIILAGAIIAVIPTLSSCCFLGIPFGIWAIVLLSRSDS